MKDNNKRVIIGIGSPNHIYEFANTTYIVGTRFQKATLKKKKDKTLSDVFERIVKDIDKNLIFENKPSTMNDKLMKPDCEKGVHNEKEVG